MNRHKKRMTSVLMLKLCSFQSSRIKQQQKWNIWRSCLFLKLRVWISNCRFVGLSGRYFLWSPFSGFWLNNCFRSISHYTTAANEPRTFKLRFASHGMTVPMRVRNEHHGDVPERMGNRRRLPNQPKKTSRCPKNRTITLTFQPKCGTYHISSERKCGRGVRRTEPRRGSGGGCARNRNSRSRRSFCDIEMVGREECARWSSGVGWAGKRARGESVKVPLRVSVFVNRRRLTGARKISLFALGWRKRNPGWKNFEMNGMILLFIPSLYVSWSLR